MRILRLTNSDDVRSDIPANTAVPALIGEQFLAVTGEPIDWIVRVIWPSAELPDIIDSWIERYQPDVVELGINGYWYIYRSVPLKLKRQFGPLGRLLGDAGLRAGDISWLVRTRGYHWTRLALLRTAGGATYFTPQEIRDLTESLARRILRHEDVSLIVRGNLWPWESAPKRDLWMYLRLKELCEKLRVPLLANDPRGVDYQFFLAMEDADRLHSTFTGRQWVADQETPALVELWKHR